MTSEDRFWIAYGKAVAVMAFLFVFTCAVAFVGLCYQAYQHDEPVFTIAPDTLKPTKK